MVAPQKSVAGGGERKSLCWFAETVKTESSYRVILYTVFNAKRIK